MSWTTTHTIRNLLHFNLVDKCGPTYPRTPYILQLSAVWPAWHAAVCLPVPVVIWWWTCCAHNNETYGSNLLFTDHPRRALYILSYLPQLSFTWPDMSRSRRSSPCRRRIKIKWQKLFQGAPSSESFRLRTETYRAAFTSSTVRTVRPRTSLADARQRPECCRAGSSALPSVSRTGAPSSCSNRFTRDHKHPFTTGLETDAGQPPPSAVHLCDLPTQVDHAYLTYTPLSGCVINCTHVVKNLWELIDECRAMRQRSASWIVVSGQPIPVHRSPISCVGNWYWSRVDNINLIKQK